MQPQQQQGPGSAPYMGMPWPPGGALPPGVTMQTLPGMPNGMVMVTGPNGQPMLLPVAPQAQTSLPQQQPAVTADAFASFLDPGARQRMDANRQKQASAAAATVPVQASPQYMYSVPMEMGASAAPLQYAYNTLGGVGLPPAGQPQQYVYSMPMGSSPTLPAQPQYTYSGQMWRDPQAMQQFVHASGAPAVALQPGATPAPQPGAMQQMAAPAVPMAEPLPASVAAPDDDYGVFEGGTASGLGGQEAPVGVDRSAPIPLDFFNEAAADGAPGPPSPAGTAPGLAGGKYRKGDEVWYRQRDGSYTAAKVVSVDESIDPPSYGIELGRGNYRETEGFRLRPRLPGQAHYAEQAAAPAVAAAQRATHAPRQPSHTGCSSAGGAAAPPQRTASNASAGSHGSFSGASPAMAHASPAAPVSVPGYAHALPQPAVYAQHGAPQQGLAPLQPAAAANLSAALAQLPPEVQAVVSQAVAAGQPLPPRVLQLLHTAAANLGMAQPPPPPGPSAAGPPPAAAAPPQPPSTGSQAATALPAAAAPVIVPAFAPAEPTAEEGDGDFGDFAVASPPPTTGGAAAGPAAEEGHSDFGNFAAASPAPKTGGPAVGPAAEQGHSDFGNFAAAPPAPTTGGAAVGPIAEEGHSDFGNFAAAPSAPTTGGVAVGPIAEGGHSDFGNFAAASPAPTTGGAAAGPAAEEGGGEFGDFAAAPSASMPAATALLPQPAAPAAAKAPAVAPAPAEDEWGDFGDFAAAPSAAPVAASGGSASSVSRGAPLSLSLFGDEESELTNEPLPELGPALTLAAAPAAAEAAASDWAAFEEAPPMPAATAVDAAVPPVEEAAALAQGGDAPLPTRSPRGALPALNLSAYKNNVNSKSKNSPPKLAPPPKRTAMAELLSMGGDSPQAPAALNPSAAAAATTSMLAPPAALQPVSADDWGDDGFADFGAFEAAGDSAPPVSELAPIADSVPASGTSAVAPGWADGGFADFGAFEAAGDDTPPVSSPAPDAAAALAVAAWAPATLALRSAVVPGESGDDKYLHVWTQLMKVCSLQLEEGARRLALAKHQGCYLQLLADPAAQRYFAALARTHAAHELLAAAARHHLGRRVSRDLLAAATKCELSWEGSSSGNGLKYAAAKAVAMAGVESEAALPAGLGRAAVETLQEWEDEEDEEVAGAGGERVVAWQEGLCALCLLPLDALHEKLPVAQWVGGRDCLALLGNMWIHEVDAAAPELP